MGQSLPAAIAVAFCIGTAPFSAQAGLSASVMSLAKNCAPNVAPITLGYIVSHESRNDRFNFNVNTDGLKLPFKATNEAEATQLIRWLEDRGASYDIGLGQVNSKNFKSLGVTAESLLDGCNNLRASAQILTACYAQAVKVSGEGQRALHQALSCYNTGSLSAGFDNGYVAKVLAQAQTIQVPALQGSAISDEAQAASKDPAARAPGGEISANPVEPVDEPDDGFSGSPDDGFQSVDPADNAPKLSPTAMRGKPEQNIDEGVLDTTETVRGTE
ncbi:TPA: lytic transglycosylase domain-containing protein [Pseudomonas putida]